MHLGIDAEAGKEANKFGYRKRLDLDISWKNRKAGIGEHSDSRTPTGEHSDSRTPTGEQRGFGQAQQRRQSRQSKIIGGNGRRGADLACPAGGITFGKSIYLWL